MVKGGEQSIVGACSSCFGAVEKLRLQSNLKFPLWKAVQTEQHVLCCVEQINSPGLLQ